MGKFLYRTNHGDWWEAEMPSEKEYKEGLKNLELCGWSVDYIISHCCPTKIQEKIAPKKEFNELTDYLDEVTGKVNFTGHYFGHYHSDQTIDKKYHCKYKDIERIL